MTNVTHKKEELTLDERVHAMQNAWTRFRDAQLYAFFHAASVLNWARENEDDFLTYCKHDDIGGDTHETRIVELMIALDTDGKAITRERRAEYGNCIGWFADRTLCPEADADKAVTLARQAGRITGIARAYRAKKDADDAVAKATKLKAQETKAKKKSSAASAAKARAIIDGGVPAKAPALAQPEFLERSSSCEASGDATKLIAFFDSEGVQPGIRRDLDDVGDDEIYMSNGTQSGPRIGIEKGPLCRSGFGLVPVANRRVPRASRSAFTSDGAARVGGACLPTGASPRGWGPGRGIRRGS